MLPSSSTSLLIGHSASIRELRATIARIAPARLPVLIQGETGVGKELVASDLHSGSGRTGRLVPFNVCAIPDTMFESTVFGHVRGAFTGAVTDAAGLLAEADRGTVFLDEIGTLSLGGQAKLLRALETGAFRPVGARMDRRCDFRVVAACNEPLMHLVDGGTFRADLAYRIGGCVLDVPPLRRRRDDIPLLVQHFSQYAGGAPLQWERAALDVLCDYAWPGNVRQLRSLVDRLHLLHDGDLVRAPDVLGLLHREQHRTSPANPAQDAEREQLCALLRAADFDTAIAARRMGVHRSTLYRRMTQLGVTVVERRASRRSRGLADVASGAELRENTSTVRANSHGVGGQQVLRNTIGGTRSDAQ
ncbi:sigma 54-interacting transcriptional regulator [Gemmatimonas sp.]|uniref:sigma 54-interacting transcriptional regulator n=1 Tax=Gemmatimonas sp. TaxID=1962908 RepID=UPI00286DAA59|nr:sigma 54-interacting transcriptional regulator [Gemmatimonas sp.]